MEKDFNPNIEKNKSTPYLLVVLSVVYIFFSYFEIYLPGIIGSSTKYLIFMLAIMFLYYFKWKIRLTTYTLFISLWLLFKIISISWSNFSNTDVSRLFISQIGMVFFLCAMCAEVRDKLLLKSLVISNYMFSFLFGILTLFFHKSYVSEVFVARQVLTLFGQQNDPNNCTVFLSVGIAIASYSLVAETKKKFLNILVILVNSCGIILSASRTGFLLLAAIAFVLVFLPNKYQKIEFSTFIKKIIVVTIVLLISIYIIKKFVPADSLNRIIAFDEYSGGSGRSEKWSEAMELIMQRPLFGWGWGGYFVGYGIVHNTYLTMLCDIGIFGFMLFMIPICKLGINLIKNKYILALLILITGIFPAISIDSINKRYFWNAIIIGVLMLESFQYTGKYIAVWDEDDELVVDDSVGVEDEVFDIVDVE